MFKRLALPVFVVLLGSLFIYAFSPASADAATVITPSTFPGSNIGTLEWGTAGSPYVIQGDVYFRYGSLTIDPGVVVKFAPAATLTVHADVVTHIEGTVSAPIYFTSLSDDSVGGDTNADGTATTPQQRDWGYLNLGGGSWNSNMNLSYVKVRYGGTTPYDDGAGGIIYPGLILNFQKFSGPGQDYTVSNIEASHDPVGLAVFVSGGNTVAVHNSSFHDDASYGVFRIRVGGIFGPGSLDVTSNWWGDPSGPYNATANPSGTGAPVDDSIFFNPWLSTDPLPDFVQPPLQSCCSSVAFLPGFEGSILKEGPNTVWPPAVFSDDLNRLAMNSDGTSPHSITVDGILNSGDIFGFVPIYKPFSDAMDVLVASTTAHVAAWEPLPYDWRLSPDDIVANGVATPNGTRDLVAEIERLAKTSNDGKVTIVAHSMGGLVGKALIKVLEDKGEGDLIENFIMVGTPQLGTPQTVGALLHGYDTGVLAPFYINPSRVRQIAQNMPGAYSLLPSPGYFTSITDPVFSFGLSGQYVSALRAFYGPFINTFNDFTSFMTAQDVPRAKPLMSDLNAPEITNSALMAKALAFHTSYDSFAFPSGTRVVQVVGWGLPTLKGITYNDQHYFAAATVEGDKYVVYPTAISSAGEKYFFNIEQYRTDKKKTFDHISLLSNPSIQDLIQKVIEGSQIFNDSYVSSVKPIPSPDSQLTISTHSPVSLGVQDALGNYTGFFPGQDSNSTFWQASENIPGSTFLNAGGSQYVFVPQDGTYSVAINGTGTGSTTVLVQSLSGDIENNVAAYSDFTVTPQSVASLSIVAGVPGPISLDQDGNGSTDQYIAQDGGLLSLAQLITNLTTAVNGLTIATKQKIQLLIKIQNINNKIAKQAQKQATILANLQAQVQRQNGKKIDSATATSISSLLDSLLATDASVPLDQPLIQQLTDEINTLPASSLKTSLLNKVTKLQNLSVLNRSLQSMTTSVSNKNKKGVLSDTDAQNILSILDQIQSAL